MHPAWEQQGEQLSCHSGESFIRVGSVVCINELRLRAAFCWPHDLYMRKQGFGTPFKDDGEESAELRDVSRPYDGRSGCVPPGNWRNVRSRGCIPVEYSLNAFYHR